ncbi:MAG: hypothetical protein P4L84_05035 [Isosphaeraceae bacterium]|nr:hypothetical protein [Isosphaeraceae bacterium]
MRRIGSAERRRQRAKVHARNSKRKARGRASRDRRLVAAIKDGGFPHDRLVMSWLSALLGKRPGSITQADVDQVVAERSAAPHAA